MMNTENAKSADRVRNHLRWAEQNWEASEPLDALSALSAAAYVLEQLTEQAVRYAREEGQSWAKIGEHLAMSKQAAHQKFGYLDR